jgi:hypothetical protein
MEDKPRTKSGIPATRSSGVPSTRSGVPAGRKTSPLQNWLTLGLVVVAVLMVALLIWVAIGSRKEPQSGPGTYKDTKDTFQYDIKAGWEVIQDESKIQIKSTTGKLPTYHLSLKLVKDLFDQNWHCDKTFWQYVNATQLAQRSVPSDWDFTVTYSSMPCITDINEPAYVILQLLFNDGSQRQSLVVIGPLNLDAISWVVTYSDPKKGDISADLVDAMTYTVKTAKLKQG